MALQTRLRRDLTNLLLSSPSYLNRLQVHHRQQQRSQLHVGGVSQRFSSLLQLRLSCDIVGAEGKRRRDSDCPSTKRASIKQDAGSPSGSFRAGDELLSARACRLPDKLIRDEVPQGPWSRQRAPDFPPKCSPCVIEEKPDCDEPCPPADADCVRDSCLVLDDPCGESSCTTTRDCCSYKRLEEKSLFSSGLLARNWSVLQSRGLHVSGLISGAGRGHSNGKSNRNKSKNPSKNNTNSSKTRKGKEICTKGPTREQCYGAKKPASSKKFTSCEPDDSWKKQRCLGDSRGSETCSVDKPQCAETVGPTYRELEKSHEDKRMKAWKQSKIAADKPAATADKCHPDDSWKEGKTCTKNSESCSSGKPQCGGAKRSYSTLVLNFQSTVQPSRSFTSGVTLSRECGSGSGDRRERDKIASDIFKKEMQEIEDCIAASKCKLPLQKPDKTNSDNKSPKKGKK